MKKTVNKSLGLAGVLLALSVMGGCGKMVLHDVLDKENYANLYIPQANTTPNYKNLLIKDGEQTISFSVYLGGVDNPVQDISVNVGFMPEMVDDFNSKNGTDYQVMPQGSYEFVNNDAVIVKGQPQSSPITIKVEAQGYMDAFTPYLLPVGITEVSDGTALNPKLSTVYFLITGSFEPGNVPRENVLQLADGKPRSIFNYYGNLITQSEAGAISLYPFLEEEGKFGPGEVINTGWEAFDVVLPFADRWIVRWGSWTGGNNGFLNSYSVAADGTIAGLVGGWFAGGFQIFDMIIPYRGSLLCRLPDGEIRRYPIDQNYIFGTMSSLGTGWSVFTQIIPYKNTLLCIDNAGDMWEYPITADGVVSPRRQVGSGWDSYRKIIPYGDDLLGIDENNAVYLYKFNPAGFWALK